MAQRALDVIPSGAQQSCDDKGFVVTVAGSEEEPLVSLLGMHNRMSRAAIFLRISASKDSLATVVLLLRCQCRRTLGQKRASPNPAAT